jgi:hypothetical protein
VTKPSRAAAGAALAALLAGLVVSSARFPAGAGRAEQVRRTLRRLEARLAEMGQAEPSPATRRVAARQLAATAPEASGVREPVPSPAGRPSR